MNSTELPLLVGAVAGVMVAVPACRWWFGRRIARLTQQLAALESARQEAERQASRDRAQSHQLEKSLRGLQRQLKTAEAENARHSAARTRISEPAPPEPAGSVDPVRAASRALSRSFADTLPMPTQPPHA